MMKNIVANGKVKLDKEKVATKGDSEFGRIGKARQKQRLQRTKTKE